MSEPKTDNESAEPTPPKNGEANPAASGEAPAVGQLSKEEQWAAFEKELKESDWGHQPC